MLTETEMKEFFQRVVDQVAELSTQAQQVSALQEQVNYLSTRVSSLEQANAELQQQVVDANNTVAGLTTELAGVHRAFDNERAVTVALRETISATDNRVVETELFLQTERDGHKITVSERDDARQKIGELESALATSRDGFNAITDDRNQWRNKAEALETEAEELRQRLSRVQAILGPATIHVVPSADVA